MTLTFLTFYLSTPKSNQHVCEPKYICDHNWVKFPSLFFRYGVHKVCGSLLAATLTIGLLTPQSNQHIYEPKYPLFQMELEKDGWK